MIEKINVAKIADLVHAAVITVPGVAGFAKVDDTENNENNEDNVIMLLKDYSQSIKFRQDGRNFYINIFIILLEGVNIKDIAREIQIRIKYELEKLDIYSNDIMIYVNLNIQDLLI